MFEQTFIENQDGPARPLAMAASLLVQCLVLGAAVLVPLLYTYDLPIEEWTRNALIFTPPSPPRPAAPKAPETVVENHPARFQQTLEAPQQIPDEVAIYQESKTAIFGIPAPDIGALGGVAGGVADGVLGVAARIEPPPLLRVGGNVQAAKIISRVTPVYPAEANEQGIEGEVRLEAVINSAGTIRQIRVVSGDPLLAASAVAAVRQWRYRPTVLNGSPVEVLTQIIVNFKITPAPPAPTPSEESKKKGRRRVRR